MTFSIVHKLFSGQKDPISYTGFHCLCFGVILSNLKICGNLCLMIICFVRWVIRGAIIDFVFFSIFMEILPCPTEFLLFDLVMIVVISLIVGIGNSSVVSALGCVFVNI